MELRMCGLADLLRLQGVGVGVVVSLIKNICA